MASPTGISLKRGECPIPATGLTDASRQGLLLARSLLKSLQTVEVILTDKDTAYFTA